MGSLKFTGVSHSKVYSRTRGWALTVNLASPRWPTPSTGTNWSWEDLICQNWEGYGPYRWVELERIGHIACFGCWLLYNASCPHIIFSYFCVFLGEPPLVVVGKQRWRQVCPKTEVRFLAMCGFLAWFSPRIWPKYRQRKVRAWNFKTLPVSSYCSPPPWEWTWTSALQRSHRAWDRTSATHLRKIVDWLKAFAFAKKIQGFAKKKKQSI